MSDVAKTLQQNQFLNQWATIHEPALNRILLAAELFVTAMEDFRATLLWADAVTQHDAAATDILGGMLDYLNTTVSQVQKAGDELGIDVERLMIATSTLWAAFRKAKERADARTPRLLPPILLAAE